MQDGKKSIKERITEIEAALAAETDKYLNTRGAYLNQLKALTADITNMDELNDVMLATVKNGGMWSAALLPWPKYTENVWQWGSELIIYDKETDRFRKYKEA